MKKLLYIFIVSFCLISCSKDLTEYYDRADQLEAANQTQAQVNKELEAANQQLKQQALRLQATLDSLAKAIEKQSTPPVLVAMAFSAAENPILTEDLICEISGSGTIECWLPQYSGSKELIPRFSFLGTEITINGVKATSGSTKYDFSSPVKLEVKSGGKTVEYQVYVYNYTGLPIMRIDTEGGQEIVSKTVYLNAHMSLTEDLVTRGPGETVEANLQIKGRGNSSWAQPKKSYRLKFDEKISLFGEHKDKSWVLIANYSDKSMLRNFITYYMGKTSSLEWTPGSHFVELVMNGHFCGTYLLCEKIKVSNHRVAVGDDGFLLEMDRRADQDSSNVFITPVYAPYMIIKEPEVTYGDANYQYIARYIAEAEQVLFSDNFKDSNEGWQKYLDMDSFVDWYLIHEIAKNADCLFNFSTYMHLKRGEKLKMGPLWDFDIAYGNVKENNTEYLSFISTDGLIVSWSQWLTRLMQDPVFLSKVRQRYSVFYNHKKDYISVLNDYANYLRHSAAENEKKWGTFYHYTYKNSDIWGTYQNEVQSLKLWLDSRMDWLKNNFKRR